MILYISKVCENYQYVLNTLKYSVILMYVSDFRRHIGVLMSDFLHELFDIY